MEKKGFTLIELLAVIVILAVISLIATPMILNVIENAKKGSAEASANAYKEALTQLIAENEIKGVNKLQINNTYYVTRGTTIGGTYYEAINAIIKIKGYKPTGYDDYIKFGKHYEIEEAVLTINGYEIKLENNKVVAVEKGEIIELEYITVTETETMERGSSYTIETIFEPINTSDQRIKYTSSDNSIVTVDENGLVKAKKNGEAKITVTPLSNKSLKKEITITVISPSEVKGIKLNKESTTIGLGKSEDIIATLEPSDATSNALTWESNNDVVSVSDSGKITGTKLGTAIVTATTQSGLKASIEVTVEYQIALNDQKYYTTNDNITIDNVDTTNKTNISCNNGSIPSINGNNVTATNITSSVECVINDSLKETVDNIDSSLNNILMINNENLNNQEIIINENDNVIFDINGKTIISTFDEDKPSILNNGNLTIKDSLSTGLLKTNYRLIKSFGNLKIESGNYKRENEESTDGGVIHIENGEAILKNSTFESDITWAIFTYDESQNTSYNPIIKINDCSISTNSGTAITNKNENGKVYLNNSNISNGNNGIENYGQLFEVDNTNFDNLKVGIYSEGGTVNVSRNTINASEAAIINYTGQLNITSGIYKSNKTVIYNKSSGIMNITDKTGKTYFYAGNVGGASGAIYNSNDNTDLSNIIIKGHRSSKAIDGTTIYDELACTSDPSTMDSGICLYSERSGVVNFYGVVNIEGMSIVSKNIGLYQVRSGKSYIKDVYIKNYGDTCDSTDDATCDAIRNHNPNGYIEIVDSNVINEHRYALVLANSNNTVVTNSTFNSSKNIGINISSAANLTFNSGTVTTDTSAPLIFINTTGTVTIKDGTFINDDSAIIKNGGTLFIENGIYSSNTNTIANFGGNIYINGGDFTTTTDIEFRAAIENSGPGTIYINGGTFKALNGGAAFKIQGKESNGNIYLCNATLNGTYDLYNIDKVAGTLYYSSNVKFTNGTNTPKTNSGAFVSANYTGTCTKN